MITFEYMQELSRLDKDELEKRIREMPEEKAKELLSAILSTVFGHNRMTIDDVAKLK